MGLKEVENGNNGMWNHPPKKKWIHCYMSVGEDKTTDASELKKSGFLVHGSGEALAVSFPPPSHATGVTTTLCPLDRRGFSAPCADDRYSHRRRGGHHPSPANGRASPHLSPSFSLSPPVLSSSSSSSSSSSCSSSSSSTSTSSSIDSPTGLGSFKGGLDSAEAQPTRAASAAPVSGGGFSIEPTLGHVSLDSPSGRINANGFLRPNGLAKSLSPLPREYEDQYGKEDSKKRSGSTPSREVHNKLEKNRRAHLKECFETLRRQLPCMEDKKISNQTILKAAHRYIQNLKRKEREYEHEMERLARQKIAHQQQLSALKKELQAKWDHIDFSAILPDMASLEQNREKETKSTTTASEQPDLEEDSHDSSGHSTSLAITSSPETKIAYPSRPMDLTPSSSNSESSAFFTSGPVTKEREATYLDPNQPLNLSTSPLDVHQRSPLRHSSPVRSPQQPNRVNGEWPLRRNSHYAASPYMTNEEKVSVASKTLTGRVHRSSTASVQTTKVSPTTTCATFSCLGGAVGRNQVSPASTNVPHISPVAVKGAAMSNRTITTTNSTGTHISHLVKSGTSVSHVPSIAKVVTTFPNLTSIPHSGASVNHVTQNTAGSNVGPIHALNSSSSPTVSSQQQQQHLIHPESNVQAIPTTVAIGTNLTHVPHLSTVGTTVARVSSAAHVSNTSSSVATVAPHEHSLPIVGGNGIQLPAQLVASGVHLSGTPGTILGQPAIQVITPEGYKLLPAEHAQNGAKPLAITLTHPGLEHLAAGEDGKTGPVMVAVSKNGLSALHLTMPASGRSLSNPIGNSVPVTSVPLNLSVGGSGTAVKVTQTGSTSILPSYLPLTHANGITQLVQGMSLVGPLVVSQSQRGIMVSASASGAKGVKAQGVSAPGGASVPLVPSPFVSTIAGNLVNSVVVVSAPTVVGQGGPTSTASVVTSSVGTQSTKQ